MAFRISLFVIINVFIMITTNAQTVVADFTILPSVVPCNVPIQFDGHLSYTSHDNNIISYEWDFDYDGITFNVQSTGIIAEHSYSRMKVAGSGENITILPYTIALRVTDDSDPANTDIATGNATLSFQNHSPIADAGGPYYTTRINDAAIPVTLTGTDSYDYNEPCDEIVTYKWDTDGDGLFGSDDTDGGLCGGSECEGSVITILNDNWMIGSSVSISLIVIDSYGFVSNASDATVQITEMNSISPTIHELIIDDPVGGDAHFEFSVSHPDETTQTFDCSFFVFPDNIEVSAYDTDDNLMSQIDYNGGNTVQNYTGYFDAVPFTDGFDTYQLQVRITMSDNRESDRISRPFKIDNTPPSNPTSCIYPGSESGECTTDNDPDFSWTGAVDNISTLLDYYFYWGRDISGESETNHTTDKGYNPDSLIENGIYYLRINTKDEAGNEAGWTTLYTYKYFNFTHIDTDSICNNDSLLWHGNYYNTAGTYYDNYYSITGCDSIYELNLFVRSGPQAFTIVGQNTVIENQIEVYLVPENADITYEWNVQNGNISDQISNCSAEIQWANRLTTGYIYVTAEDQYGCVSDSAIFEVAIGTTGFKTVLEKSYITVYPNPVKDIIHIRYDKDFQLELYDIHGRKILTSNKRETDLSNIKQGIYIVLVKNKENDLIKVIKLVKE